MCILRIVGLSELWVSFEPLLEPLLGFKPLLGFGSGSRVGVGVEVGLREFEDGHAAEATIGGDLRATRVGVGGVLATRAKKGPAEDWVRCPERGVLVRSFHERGVFGRCHFGVRQ
eukprot:scaffold14562_cov60-Phaeocystis_antarctica.AAC.4